MDGMLPLRGEDLIQAGLEKGYFLGHSFEMLTRNPSGCQFSPMLGTDETVSLEGSLC